VVQNKIVDCLLACTTTIQANLLKQLVGCNGDERCRQVVVALKKTNKRLVNGTHGLRNVRKKDKKTMLNLPTHPIKTQFEAQVSSGHQKMNATSYKRQERIKSHTTGS